MNADGGAGDRLARIARGRRRATVARLVGLAARPGWSRAGALEHARRLKRHGEGRPLPGFDEGGARTLAFGGDRAQSTAGTWRTPTASRPTRRLSPPRSRPGVVVVDLGAGSGVLGILACRAGARRVYVVEALATMELARRLVSGERFRGARGVPARAGPPPSPSPSQPTSCSVIGLGCFGVGAGLLGSLADARRRFPPLPGARSSRSGSLSSSRAVDAKALGERVQFWLERPVGLDLVRSTSSPPTLRFRRPSGHRCCSGRRSVGSTSTSPASRRRHCRSRSA